MIAKTATANGSSCTNRPVAKGRHLHSVGSDTCVAGYHAEAAPLDVGTASVHPFWQTEPCPPWCDGGHEDGDFYEDRNHWLLSGAQPIELSLHDPWSTVQVPAAENVTGHDIPAAYGPEVLDVGVVQHYRASAPDVLLVVPRFGKDDRVDGEMDVRLTAAEAARLRERLTAVLVAVTSAPPVLHAPQAATRTSSIDAHCAQLLAAEPSCGGRLEAEPHTVKLGTPKIDEMSIEACLSAWSGDGGPRDFEVTIDVDHSILVSCTPQQAREAAESLRRIAGVIAELADAAEALQQGEPELGSRAATEPVALVAYRADMPSAA